MVGGVKHSYKVAVETGQAVFHDRVHMLTALRLWSCTFKRLPWINSKAVDAHRLLYKLRENLAWTEAQLWMLSEKDGY